MGEHGLPCAACDASKRVISTSSNRFGSLGPDRKVEPACRRRQNLKLLLPEAGLLCNCRFVLAKLCKIGKVFNKVW
jgi:hypothetical protein